MKKKVRATIELILGLFGVFSPTDMFKEIFFELFKEGNQFALVGYITAVFIGIIFLLDGIAIILGYEHLGEMIKDLKQKLEQN